MCPMFTDSIDTQLTLFSFFQPIFKPVKKRKEDFIFKFFQGGQKNIFKS